MLPLIIKALLLLAEYTQQARDAVLSYVVTLSPESLLEPREAFGKYWTPLERMLSQLRHVQHHVGAMHVRVNKHVDQPLQWIGYNE